jgi:hypothetical protein
MIYPTLKIGCKSIPISQLKSLFLNIDRIKDKTNKYEISQSLLDYDVYHNTGIGSG